MENYSFSEEILQWPGELKWPNSSVKFFVSQDWDTAIVNFLKAAALVFKKDYKLSSSKTEDSKQTSRDDNGGYFWEGSFKYGNEEEYILVEYFGDQAEEMVYPMPLDETRIYLVKGINQTLQLICSYQQYAASLSAIKLTLKMEGNPKHNSKIKKLFNKHFSTTQ